jgi:hypothetical protein
MSRKFVGALAAAVMLAAVPAAQAAPSVEKVSLETTEHHGETYVQSKAKFEGAKGDPRTKVVTFVRWLGYYPVPTLAPSNSVFWDVGLKVDDWTACRHCERRLRSSEEPVIHGKCAQPFAWIQSPGGSIYDLKPDREHPLDGIRCF